MVSIWKGISAGRYSPSAPTSARKRGSSRSVSKSGSCSANLRRPGFFSSAVFNSIRASSLSPVIAAKQARLYSLALMKMLGDSASDRFGGVIYSFLRGVDASGEHVHGIHYDKPTVLELDELEADLGKRDWKRA